MNRAAVFGSVVVLTLGSGHVRAVADAGPLSLADLPEYAEALKAKADREGASAVTFRALWDHPGRYRGHRVRVEGRLMSRFRQEAIGELPALEEVWVFSPSGDPFCLVFPASKGKPSPSKASTVRFEGTFLRLIWYQGGDAPRVVPLIVGDRPPKATAPVSPAAHSPRPRDSRLDWGIGLAVAAIVALVLGLQHARKPARRNAGLDGGPEPDFLDPGGFPGQSDQSPR